mgnify:CR=1 FL=1
MRNFRLDDESGHQEALFSWAAYRTEIMPEGRAIREDAEKRRISVTNRQRGYAACILARRGNHKAARRQKY